MRRGEEREERRERGSNGIIIILQDLQFSLLQAASPESAIDRGAIAHCSLAFSLVWIFEEFRADDRSDCQWADWPAAEVWTGPGPRCQEMKKLASN